MPLYELSDPGPLLMPALVVALEGWVNAGEAGTTSAEVVAGDGEVIASFASDQLYDYRATRPTVDFEEGAMTEVTWPRLVLRRRRVSGRDLLVLTGIEPNWNWQRLSREVAELAARLGVTRHVSLGGIPWATPHTRPVTIISTVSKGEAPPPGEEHPEGLLRVPGSAVNVLEHAAAERGIPTLGLWARVPHYVGTAYHAAALSLVQRLCEELGIELDLADLTERTIQQHLQFDAIADARPEIRAMIDQLEGLTDRGGTVTGEQIAAEIEKYLREQGSAGGEEGFDR